MGMFDYVLYPPQPCPACGTEVSGWQSKGAGCNLDTITPDKVRRFYSSCDNCNTWMEFEVIPTSYVVKLRTKED